MMAAYQAKRPSRVLATTEIIAVAINPLLFTMLVLLVSSRTTWRMWLNLLCTMVAPTVGMVHLIILQTCRLITSISRAIRQFI